MTRSKEINTDMLSFWNGHGGHTWVERQEHTDTILANVNEAFLNFADPATGERVLDIGCGCGAPSLEFARAVGPSGSVVALDISGPMLAEAAARSRAAEITNIDWRQEDPAVATLDEFDLLISAFGNMFFGDPIGAFTNMRRAASSDARMAFICWRSLSENPWMEVPMRAVEQHLPPRPKPVANAPGMFAFANPERISEVLTSSGWASPHVEKFDTDLDIAAGRGLEEAVLQSTQIGAINSWLRNQTEEIRSRAIVSLREALTPFADGANVRLPCALWIVSSTPA